ncbi:unnamed protein product [Closterium sp. NIES-54]
MVLKDLSNHFPALSPLSRPCRPSYPLHHRSPLSCPAPPPSFTPHLFSVCPTSYPLPMCHPAPLSSRLPYFTQRNLLRIYPFGLRVTSSNYDPMPAWLHGAQMVAMNMQVSMPDDVSMHDDVMLSHAMQCLHTLQWSNFSVLIFVTLFLLSFNLPHSSPVVPTALFSFPKSLHPNLLFTLAAILRTTSGLDFAAPCQLCCIAAPPILMSSFFVPPPCSSLAHNQGYGRPLWIVHGFFSANGGCGYIKKPDFYLTPGKQLEGISEGDESAAGSTEGVYDPSVPRPIQMTLRVRVVVGTGWLERYGKGHFDTYSKPDFYCKVSIEGAPSDSAEKKLDTCSDDWCPCWDGTTLEFPLILPELALLCIEVNL